MAQAETILQHRIGCLDRKPTAKLIAAARVWSGLATLSNPRAKPGKTATASS